MKIIDFKEFKIHHIVKPTLKNIYISIDAQSKILLKTPNISQKHIEKLLIDKEIWINKQLDKLKSSPKVVLDTKKSDFSIDVLRKYFLPKLDKFAKIMNLEYRELKIKKLKSRWGSCSSLKIITLNSELINVPDECIEYVIVHELAHLVYMNHSKDFHNLVKQYLHDEKERRKKLRTYYLK